MEIRQLATFIRVAQFNSFSRAAESLGYSQSAVTVQIRQLEEELDTRLFDRMGKRVILTAQGQCFLEYANSILDTIHTARRALSEDAELEGCTVLDDATGEELGKLDKVLHYPAHKVYQVRGGAHEYLIPAVPDVFIVSADPDAEGIRGRMMKGLATDED